MVGGTLHCVDGKSKRVSSIETKGAGGLSVPFLFGSDCSGIGAPEMALKEMGKPFRSVMACDVDAHAKKSFHAVHGAPEMWFDDLTKREHSVVPSLDLYVAGFPCQTFSLAGNRKGFDDVRGTVFFDVAEFIRVNQPRTFILENVKGLIGHDNGKTFSTVLEVLAGNGTVNGQMSIPLYEDGMDYCLFWKVLNTKEHGIPQNRERVFLVGFREPRGFSFPIPEKLELTLSDMLESNVPDKYFLSDKMINYISKDREGNEKLILNREVANTITCEVKKMQRSAQDNYVRIKTNNSKGYEDAFEGDSVNYQNVQSKTRRGRVGKQISQTLDTGGEIGVVGSGTIRRLTPLECWRLQGFPDEAFERAAKVVSDSQLYKQAGNSMTVKVMVEILNKIYN